MTHCRPIYWTSQNECQIETEAVRSPLSSVSLLGHSRGVAPGTPVPFSVSGGIIKVYYHILQYNYIIAGLIV
jgi:hypothetical protein